MSSTRATKIVQRLLWPGLIPIFVAWVWLRAASAPEEHLNFWRFLPLLLAGAAMGLGFRFGRSRAFLTAAMVALTGLGLSAWGTEIPGTNTSWLALQVISVMLPINLAMIGSSSDRGVLSLSGILWLSWLVAACLIVSWVVQAAQIDVASILGASFFELTFLEQSRLEQPALVAFLVAGVVLLWRLIRHTGPIEASLFGVLVAVFLALLAPVETVRFWVYLSSAALIAALAVIESFHTLAFSDELTGLPSRRSLNESLERLSGKYTLAMVDIDRFKRVNDRHGHHVGDQVLRMVAGVLDHVDGGGKAYRYGGEEFAIVFAGLSLSQARTELDRLRVTVAKTPFTVRGRLRPRKRPLKPSKSGKSRQQLKVTVSVGAASPANKGQQPSHVLKRADKALYRAKHSGRNRVVT